MTDDHLVKTLPLQLAIDTDGGESLLREACNEARSAYNQPIHDTKYGIDWDTIHNHVEADLVKNTRQRIVEKAFDAVENFHEYNDYGYHNDYGYPDHLTEGLYSLRMNFTERVQPISRRRDGRDQVPHQRETLPPRQGNRHGRPGTPRNPPHGTP